MKEYKTQERVVIILENRKYFIALSGAKKNVGDFLITNRALALLNHIGPDFEYIVKPHWEFLDNIDFVNKSEGIIILGGPGFQMNMFPGVYKLFSDLSKIKVPIYTLGTGWKGKPGDKTTEKLYHFLKPSVELINKINETSAGISCRDYQTVNVLKNNAFNNVTMTGCPVWYDIPSIGKEFLPPKKISKIVYTPAQDELFSDQSIEVLKFIINRFKDSKIIVSFHRGIGEVDKYTDLNDANNTQKIATVAKKLGAEIVDVSYSAEKLNFYDECDLHIGYRVHAHIYFLSKRLPSILLHEDGRGNGVSDALKSPGIDGYKIPKLHSLLFSMFNHNYYLSKIYSKIGMKLNKNIINELDQTLKVIESTNYSSFIKTSKFIDEHYKVMEKFIKKMINV